MSIYPTVRPSLTLDFQKSKQLDPRISFSRSSIATYVEGGVIKYADEHQARFEDEGLLIEETKANIYKYSNLMNPTGNSAPSNFTPNAGTAPDGTNTALKLVQKPASDGVVDQGQTVQIGKKDGPLAVFSVFAKAGEDRYLFITPYLSASLTPPVFDLQTGEISNSNNHAAVMQPLANGWYRCSLRVRRGGFASMKWGISNVADAPKANNGIPFEGDGTSGLYVWGAQYELQTPNAANGDSPIEISDSSFIPTSGSELTRAADIAQITGDNFSSWYNQSEGTMFVSMQDGSRSNFGANLRGSHSHDRVIMQTESDFRLKYQATGRYTPSSSNVNINSANDVRTADPMKYAYAYKPFDYALSVKGSIATDTLKDPQPNISYLELGMESVFGGSQRLNGAISRVSYYPERLTNEQLEAITL